MHQSFCLKCFYMMSPDENICPACKAPVAAFSAREYMEKLIGALEHPLADVRMRVIIALGMRGDSGVAQRLADCALQHPVDVVEGLEVVKSLRKMKQGKSRQMALEMLARQHPAAVVRIAAMSTLTLPVRQ